MVGNSSMESVSLAPVRNLMLFQNITMKISPTEYNQDYTGKFWSDK